MLPAGVAFPGMNTLPSRKISTLRCVNEHTFIIPGEKHNVQQPQQYFTRAVYHNTKKKSAYDIENLGEKLLHSMIMEFGNVNIVSWGRNILGPSTLYYR